MVTVEDNWVMEGDRWPAIRHAITVRTLSFIYTKFITGDICMCILPINYLKIIFDRKNY
jgi:hypothetical protein